MKVGDAMNRNFFDFFKQYLLDHHKDEIHTFISYYQTLLQNKKELQPLITDYENWNFNIQHEKDHDGYSNGKFEIWLYRYETGELESEDYVHEEYPNYHYELNLTFEERYWGYCMCSSEDDGYNAEHACCGNGCDWIAPSFDLYKIENISHSSFNGVEKDLWKIEEEWGEHLVEHKEEIKRNKLKRIESEIKRLLEEKESLL